MTTQTTRVFEHGGKTIEVTACGHEWFATIDGAEMAKPFPSASHAIDAAKRKVTLANSKEGRAAARARRATAAADYEQPDEWRAERERRERERFETFRARVADLLDVGSFDEYRTRTAAQAEARAEARVSGSIR